jgi:hypothetical protein
MFCEYSKLSWMIDDHELTVSQQHRGAPFAKAQGVICIIGIIRAIGIQDEVDRTRQTVYKQDTRDTAIQSEGH